MAILRPSVLSDIAVVAKNMREEDVNELNVSVTRIDRKLDDMIDEQNKEDATLYIDEYQLGITGEVDTIYE